MELLWLVSKNEDEGVAVQLGLDGAGLTQLISQNTIPETPL